MVCTHSLKQKLLHKRCQGLKDRVHLSPCRIQYNLSNISDLPSPYQTKRIHKSFHQSKQNFGNKDCICYEHLPFDGTWYIFEEIDQFFNLFNTCHDVCLFGLSNPIRKWKLVLLIICDLPNTCRSYSWY